MEKTRKVPKNKRVLTRMMKILRAVAGLLAMAAAFSSSAQNLYQFTFHGVESSLTASGDSVDRKITDKSMAAEWAARIGATNAATLELAFHHNVDPRGDSIDLIDKNDGTRIDTLFLLFFPESASAPTAKGVTEQRFAYVYNTRQSDFSRGTAILIERTSVNNKGQTNRFSATGDMQWYVLPEGTNGLRIATGKFKIGKPLVFH